jgi:hypothetical protein
VTALAKAIAASSPPDLDHADPLPVPTTGGSPGGSSTALISTKPGSAAASQPLNQTLANGLANQNMVPQTNPNSVPQTIQNSVLGLAAAQQQPGEGSLVVPLQPGEGSLVVP